MNRKPTFRESRIYDLRISKCDALKFKERGFTLIEVMVAAAVLGITATALFGLFSTSLGNLQKVEELHRYQLAAEEIMNRVLLLSALPGEAEAEGRIDNLSARWTVQVVPWIPETLEGNPADAVLKIDVQVFWPGRSAEQSVRLETVRPQRVIYSNYDLEGAIAGVFPNP
jgi:prepilin-type N-terminal cleavage/methylation domain-containing protein